MTTDDRAALAARHYSAVHPAMTETGREFCAGCRLGWPCDTARALALPPDPDLVFIRRADAEAIATLLAHVEVGASAGPTTRNLARRESAVIALALGEQP